MPIPAYMRVEGVTSGVVSEGALSPESIGNLYQDGHEEEFMVQAFSHSIMIPRDSQSGQPSGTRIHRPLTVTKIFDKSSPLLYNCLVTGESLTCEITWYRTSAEGAIEVSLSRYFNLPETHPLSPSPIRQRQHRP